jgi:hypothetical protein
MINYSNRWKERGCYSLDTLCILKIQSVDPSTQEDGEVEASLGYMATPCLKNQNKQANPRPTKKKQ